MYNILTTNTLISSKLGGPIDRATVTSNAGRTDARNAVHRRMAAVIFFFRTKS